MEKCDKDLEEQFPTFTPSQQRICEATGIMLFIYWAMAGGDIGPLQPMSFSGISAFYEKKENEGQEQKKD